VDGLKSVRSTYLYSQINKNEVLDKNIRALLTKGVVLKTEDVTTQINTITSFYKGVLKTNVLEAFEKGIVEARCFPKGITAEYKIPNTFPFILVPAGNDIKAVAIVDNDVSHDKAIDKINIDTQKFYTLLETAYVARALQKDPSILRMGQVLSSSAGIWAHMFTRLLNKKLALNIDKKAFEKVLYLAAKFYLLNLLGLKATEVTNNYAAKLCKNVERITLQRIDQEFLAHWVSEKRENDSKNPYDNIATFIQCLSTMGVLISTGLHDITVRDYLKDFIGMYGNAALLALEHPSYFIFNIFSAVNGAFLNNQYAFKDIIARTGMDVYGQICLRAKGR
jgi:hypothetical protein